MRNGKQHLENHVFSYRKIVMQGQNRAPKVKNSVNYTVQASYMIIITLIRVKEHPTQQNKGGKIRPPTGLHFK